MDQYMEAVQAAASADKAKRWTQPVKIFGYIVIVFAAIIAALGILAGIVGLFTSRAGNAALAAVPGSLIIAAVLFLQGSVVLMFAYYVQMRAEEVSMRVTKLLEDDAGDSDGTS